MTITYRCGHSTTQPATIQACPACGTCGETVVSRVKDAQPHFVGTVRGPFAEFKALEPVIVDLKPAREK